MRICGRWSSHCNSDMLSKLESSCIAMCPNVTARSRDYTNSLQGYHEHARICARVCVCVCMCVCLCVHAWSCRRWLTFISCTTQRSSSHSSHYSTTVYYSTTAKERPKLAQPRSDTKRTELQSDSSKLYSCTIASGELCNGCSYYSLATMKLYSD